MISCFYAPHFVDCFYLSFSPGTCTLCRIHSRTTLGWMTQVVQKQQVLKCILQVVSVPRLSCSYIGTFSNGQYQLPGSGQ